VSTASGPTIRHSTTPDAAAGFVDTVSELSLLEAGDIDVKIAASVQHLSPSARVKGASVQQLR
jgi:hypothetical protein